MHNLALLHQAKGRLDEAEKLFEEALTGLRRAVGSDNRNTQMTMGILAGLYEARDKAALAEPLRRAQVAALRETVGVDSPTYASGLATLTVNLLGQRKYAD